MKDKQLSSCVLICSKWIAGSRMSNSQKKKHVWIFYSNAEASSCLPLATNFYSFQQNKKKRPQILAKVKQMPRNFYFFFKPFLLSDNNTENSTLGRLLDLLIIECVCANMLFGHCRLNRDVRHRVCWVNCSHHKCALSSFRTQNKSNKSILSCHVWA